MNDTLKTPRPHPVVSPLLFWISLGTPPSIICCVTLTVHLMMDPGPGERLMLAVMIALFMFSVIAFSLVLFHHAVGKRYRGPSLEYLCAAFFLGQVIVCMAMGLYFCLPILPF